MSDLSGKCLICDKVLSKSNLIRHERLVHKVLTTKDGTFRCLEAGCDKSECTYSTHSAIRKHIDEFHTVTKTSADPSTCNICDKKFTKKHSLYKHVRLVHKIAMQTGTLKCPVEGCEHVRFKMAGIRFHLAKAHRVPNVMEKVEKTFPSLEDFMAWKTEEEKEKQSSFIALRTSKQIAGMKRQIYYCHRSGKFRPGGTGKRRMKLQGSCKIGKICPAAMRADFSSDGTVKLEYWSGHFGHSTSLAYMRLTDAEREEIARKLGQGKPFIEVLDEIRNSIEGPLQRIHLLSRRDLHNIVASFDRSVKHPESDAVSVASWVEELQELDESPVILYKTQGVGGGGYMTLSEEDFLLVLMTRAQREMIRFVSDKICIDTIHGTNVYDFHLTTALIVDESGAAFPVAFCISNKISTAHMQQFIGAVREKVGLITASVFMSQDDPAYYYAWKTIMGDAEHHLLCTWHVDKIWRQQIQEKVTGDKSAQASVHKKLRALMETKNEEDLKTRVRECIRLFLSDDATRAFGEYFRSAYASRLETWAFCFRAQAGIGKNVQLESMHKELERIYLEAKKVKQLDKRLSALMKLSRETTFEHMIRLCENSRTMTVLEISERHKKSLDIPSSDIVPEEDGWNVTSQTNRNKTYHVQRVEGNCHATCKMMCYDCHVCIHMYACTCVDAMVYCTVCEHVHAVIRKIVQEDESQGMVAYTVEIGNDDDINTLIHAFNEAQEPESRKQSLERTLNCCLAFIASDHSVEDSKVLQLDTFLKKWLAEVQSKQPCQPADVEEGSPNKNIKLQDYRLAKTK